MNMFSGAMQAKDKEAELSKLSMTDSVEKLDFALDKATIEGLLTNGHLTIRAVDCATDTGVLLSRNIGPNRLKEIRKVVDDVLMNVAMNTTQTHPKPIKEAWAMYQNTGDPAIKSECREYIRGVLLLFANRRYRPFSFALELETWRQIRTHSMGEAAINWTGAYGRMVQAIDMLEQRHSGVILRARLYHRSITDIVSDNYAAILPDPSILVSDFYFELYRAPRRVITMLREHPKLVKQLFEELGRYFLPSYWQAVEWLSMSPGFGNYHDLINTPLEDTIRKYYQTENESHPKYLSDLLDLMEQNLDEFEALNEELLNRGLAFEPLLGFTGCLYGGSIVGIKPYRDCVMEMQGTPGKPKQVSFKGDTERSPTVSSDLVFPGLCSLNNNIDYSQESGSITYTTAVVVETLDERHTAAFQKYLKTLMQADIISSETSDAIIDDVLQLYSTISAGRRLSIIFSSLSKVEISITVV